MKDLVLIRPPDPVLFNPTMYFPLGILYLAAVVKNAGYDVEVVDAREGLPEQIPPAWFYGFSCDTPHIKTAKILAKKLGGLSIIGGVHSSVLPEDCVKNFDYVVVGEGEQVILDIMEGTRDPGIIKAPLIGRLDEIPYPLWQAAEKPFSETLFPGEKYGKGEIAATIIASRGCPFTCVYCANLFTKPVRYRSIRNIIGELKELKKLGVTHFRFEDDNMTLHPHFTDLLKAIKKLNIRWKCHTRSGLLIKNPEITFKMFEAGCEECGLGVESADPHVLTVCNKQDTVQNHIIAIHLLKQAGIRAKTYFVAGLPGETHKTLKFNMEFMKNAKPDKWTLSTFTPYPGSDTYKNPEKYGIRIIDRDFDNWWNFVPDHFVHVLDGQIHAQMWDRYTRFHEFLTSEVWKNG